MEEESVLIICAHSDDHILGCGGSMAKFAKQGIPIYTIILSYGEKSHPHLKEEFVIKTRVKEAQQANAIIGGKQIFFLGLKEGKFEEDFKKSNSSKKILDIIEKNNITKVFTHSNIDIHPDHIAANKLIRKTIKSKNIEVYSFIIWDLFRSKKKLNSSIKLVIDTTHTAKTKLHALNAFKSQKMQMSLPYFQTQIESFFNGIKYGYKFAEVFIKEK